MSKYVTTAKAKHGQNETKERSEEKKKEREWKRKDKEKRSARPGTKLDDNK